MALGVDNVKKVAGLIVDVANQCVDSFKDGFHAIDLTSFFDEAIAIAGAKGSFKEFVPELKDLTKEEIAEVVKHVQAKLDIENDKAEALVKAIFDAIVANASVYYAVKELRS